jgi:tetratricopeptide (TPR) repeat protein
MVAGGAGSIAQGTMPEVVVFAFAVADGLLPAVGAAPYDVLARQLPRLLVARLNGDADRGARYFPFVGNDDGRRTFLSLTDFVAPERLAELHRQPDVRLLVDARLDADGLHWRIHDANRAALLRACTVPFDPRQPLAPLPRLEFEIGDLLGRTDRPQPIAALAGEALGWWLIAKDAVLRAETNLLADGDGDPLRAALRLVELAADEPLAQDVALELAAHVARRSRTHPSLAALVGGLTPHLVADVERLERHAALAQTIGDEHAAATSLARAARLAPQRPELTERAAALLYRCGRHTELSRLVQALRDQGQVSPIALAQLAAVADRIGDRRLRGELTAELLTRPTLPVAVARLLVSFLLEEERAEPARAVAERALAADPAHGMLQFELGRACLLLGDDAAAATALAAALALGVAPAVQAQARRLQRLARVPGLWRGSCAVEAAVAAGDLPTALLAARRLVAAYRDVPEALYLLGLVRHKLAQPRRAERWLRRALAGDPDCADTHNRLGVLLLERGALREGHEHLRTAHRLAPDDAAPLLHLAQACALLGEPTEARQHLVAAQRCGADPQLLAAVEREVASRCA